MSDKKEIKASDVDQMVCNLSIDARIYLTEEQQIRLVDEICELFGIDAKEGLT